jgi:hypothetical protein
MLQWCLFIVSSGLFTVSSGSEVVCFSGVAMLL